MMSGLERRLAELVRGYPQLYDRSRSDWKDSAVQVRSWREIALQLGEQDPQHCRSVWRNLRHKFTKAKKRLILKNGEQARNQAPRLYSALLWLNPYLQARRSGHTPSPDKETLKIICKEEFDAKFAVTQSPSFVSTAESESSTPFSVQHAGRLPLDGSDHLTDYNRILSELDKGRRPEPCDLYDRYALTIADFMRGLSRRRCSVFKKRVNDLMYELDMEELDEAGL